MDTTDEERFTALYRRHHDALWAYAARRTHAADVADTVAETFTTAWRRLDDVPPTHQLPWLYATARRVLANRRRAEQRRAGLQELLNQESSTPAAPGTPVADEAATRTDLARAFDALSEPDAELLRLLWWEELTAADVGRVLGVTATVVRVRAHRARKRLRAQLADYQVASTTPGGATAAFTARTHARPDGRTYPRAHTPQHPTHTGEAEAAAHA